MIHYEDLEVGSTSKFGHYDVTREEVIEFARKYDPQPFHIDPAAAAESIYGGIIASGFHTLTLAFELILAANVWNEASMGSPGLDEIRWKMPVRPGDSLRVTGEVTEVQPSASRPDRGRVVFRYDILNQNDARVAYYYAIQLLKRR